MFNRGARMFPFQSFTFGMALLCFGTLALAEEGGQRIQLNSKMEQECSACHIAFRPNFLPTSSWMQVMRSLDKHFGTDASLSNADHKEITDWIVANTQEIGSPPPGNRITKSFWFTRKHGTSHVKADVWSRDSVKSPANCQACHVNAAQGDFNEHNVRIPR
jgi:hypothetical protein